ncbi:hypothetical protein ASPACDRAFT_1879885 [Aspergillus aculeatus ATCC 16872]|uniref:Zn(II)2Cys6 transcription factor n=1 Tax=Aspergillus aculeatus (strain ATCC 16872 / CBS 172.66 / WB 5094) TaxID=690307 RepID=A0A1L9WYW6_ASPA1|nr:uncharacterized protein ASPACDRAFT_1879885 [Aspergillus aculeatus ATCC 16872]OJK01309.1 hypothetical protein ASPACDRAFT_1879885 [Aspergillus aculeatus ATCC 16872]
MTDLLENKNVLTNHAYQLYYARKRLVRSQSPSTSSSLATDQADEVFYPKLSISPSSYPSRSDPHLSKSKPSSPRSSLTDPAVDCRSNEPEACTLGPCDLTLLARWCASTHRSLSLDGRNGSIWRSRIVREGMSYPPLLNSILALSALDMLYNCGRDSVQMPQHKQQHLRRLVILHWDRASAGLDNQINPARSGLPRNDSISLFALCNILIVLAFGHIRWSSCSPPPSSSSSSCRSAIVDFCYTVRQVRGSPEILVQLIDDVAQGELASLVRPEEASHRMMPNTFTLAIHALRNKAQVNKADPEARLDPSTSLIYSQAIDRLSSCLQYLTWSSRPGLLGLSWLLEIPAGFVDLALDQQPIALTILAHYCVVLYHLRSQWWMGNLGIQILKEISQLLGRDDRLGDIQWAIDAIAGDCDANAG